MRDHFAAVVKTLFALAALAVFTFAINSAFSIGQEAGQVASVQKNCRLPQEYAASYIEARLAAQGFSVERRQYQHEGRQVRSLEVSLINVTRNKSPDRILIVGAHYDATRGGGTAIVLELARMLKDMHPGLGTEIKFVFFFNDPPDFGGGGPGNFIAFVGTYDASALVHKKLGAFKLASHFRERHDYPAIVITDTNFPHYHAANDKLDYESTARAVETLAKVIESIAGPMQM